MYSTYERKNIYKEADENTLKTIFDYSEGYKRFLDNGKTERETVEYTVEMLEKAGYKEYKLGDKIDPHDKLYFNNRGKALFIVKAGSAEKIKEGVRILVAHVDSPRLDLKQVPLYEKSELAFLKTHYYGGIKKYQWLTIPLALHGVVVKADGTKINIKIGENDTDPVFYITDLLPHLSQEQVKKTIGEGFDAENMNLVVGGMSLSGEDKDAVKKNVLSILMKEYGMCEEDFLSAELEVVPALKARDVGFDRAFVAGYRNPRHRNRQNGYDDPCRQGRNRLGRHVGHAVRDYHRHSGRNRQKLRRIAVGTSRKLALPFGGRHRRLRSRLRVLL